MLLPFLTLISHTSKLLRVIGSTGVGTLKATFLARRRLGMAFNSASKIAVISFLQSVMGLSMECLIGVAFQGCRPLCWVTWIAVVLFATMLPAVLAKLCYIATNKVMPEEDIEELRVPMFLMVVCFVLVQRCVADCAHIRDDCCAPSPNSVRQFIF